ncbi:histidine kinase [Quadrisphaera sp. INWT6]|uniref:sensor histidine kinase n=1 Tax=Quadrisphaera sp. INWT6 TaxID=2596917 RepID=UPI0018926F3C|nr:histidine kinase [Quadrisphaera sp. INWT6]MBF5080231.1 hypothetical protein [Quadrisphaera sp. INWT6]
MSAVVEPRGEEAAALASTARTVLDLRLACVAAAMLVVAQRPEALGQAGLLALALPVSLVPVLAWRRVARVLLRRWEPVLADSALSGALLALVSSDAVQVLAGATVFLATLLRGGVGGLAALGFVVAAQVLKVGRGTATLVDASAHTAVLAGLAWAALHLRQLLVDRAVLRREVEDARVAAVRHSERSRLARDLHDSLASTLHGVHLLAGALESRLLAGAPLPEAAQRAGEVATAAARARGEARALLTDLRERSAPDLLGALDDVVAAAAARGVRVRVSCDAPLALATAAVHELSGALGELVENAVRHGGGSDVVVALEAGCSGGPRVLRCTVTDGGPGLPGPLDLAALRRAGRFGLVGVHERLEALGGTAAFERPACGGLRAVLTVPLDRDQQPPVAPHRVRVARLLPAPRTRATPSPRGAAS